MRWPESEEHDAALVHIERVIALTPQWDRCMEPGDQTRESDLRSGALCACVAPCLQNRPGEPSSAYTNYPDERPTIWTFAPITRVRCVLAAGRVRPSRSYAGYSPFEPDNSGALGDAPAHCWKCMITAMQSQRWHRRKRWTQRMGAWCVPHACGKFHNMRELIIDGTFGTSSGGGPTGTQDYAVDTRCIRTRSTITIGSSPTPTTRKLSLTTEPRGATVRASASNTVRHSSPPPARFRMA